jgi:CubicO group peptidase (beta-lactamase class C family)
MTVRSYPRRAVASLVAAAVTLAAPATVFAQSNGATRTTPPAVSSSAPQLKAGFARDRLAKLDAFLQSYVDSNRLSGVVALVLRDGQVAYERSVGLADIESRRRMTMDAMFRIASQSKALTSVAVMILMEEGKLSLNNPVSNFLPEFARTTVATRVADTGRTIAPAMRRVTIRDLLTHTAGISYGTDQHVASLYEAKGLGPAAGFGWYLADKDETVCQSMERLATLPFVRQPGEAWVYGYNTDILGCVVERVSGMPLDKFIESRITAPLGMTDTHFFVPESKRQRLVTVYGNDSAKLVRAPEGPRGQGSYVDGPRKDFSGGAGLISTARDYARFLEMLRNGGEVDGVRILSRKTVELMTTNQVGTLYSSAGMGFGLGFSIVERVGADNTMHSLGTFGWGGAYGSQYRVDPEERITWVLMINQVPNRTDIAAKFPVLLYAALVK